MGTKLILPLITSITPLIILAVYLFNPGNKAIRYFLPRFLSDGEYPKAVLRQAGSGCLFLSVWLFAIIVAVASTADFKAIEKIPWLMALLFFILPVVLAMFFCVGFYYLLFVCILSLTVCGICGKPYDEKLIPLNVACLIGFIITLWRIRTYIAKTAIAMDLSGEKYFFSTLFSPVAMFFVWIHAFALIRKFNQYQLKTQN
jgi:hypothetical protein